MVEQAWASDLSTLGMTVVFFNIYIYRQVIPNSVILSHPSVPITLKEFENVSTFLSCTECKDMVVSQDNHMLYLLH